MWYTSAMITNNAVASSLNLGKVYLEEEISKIRILRIDGWEKSVEFQAQRMI